MSERLTLALDGSTLACSVALLGVDEGAEGGGSATVLCRRSENGGRSQARILLRLVDEMLEEVSATPGDLGRVVVGTGPGTFTGVRIAVATARGLAVGLRIPVFGVSTLSALAACGAEDGSGGLLREPVSLVPVIDAHRQQSFFAVYEPVDVDGVDEGQRWVRRTAIGVGDRGRLMEGLAAQEGRVVVVGQDVGLAGEMPPQASFVRCDVKAEYLVVGRRWISEAVASQEEVADVPGDQALESPGAPESVRPIYVRAPDADIHITKMRDPWG